MRAMVGAALLLVRRKAGMIDHETFKGRLQTLWQRCTRGDQGRAVQGFLATLQPYLRSDLLELVRAGRDDAVLATAAAGDYAVSLGARLGFAHVLPDNVGMQKRQSVLQFLVKQGWESRERVLFTDHEDDLPLMAVCQTVYWFGTAQEEARMRKMLPEVEVRAAEEVRKEGVLF